MTDTRFQLEEAIDFIKSKFINELLGIGLRKLSAPLLLAGGTGFNDDLSGIEKPLGFPLGSQFKVDDTDPNISESKSEENSVKKVELRAEVPQSLAKWKRVQLARLGCKPGNGIVISGTYIRPDEEISAIHSFTVDQWDWEQCITSEERTLTTLKRTVRSIYAMIRKLENDIVIKYPNFVSEAILPNDIIFIHSEQLIRMFPNKTSKQREHLAAKRFGAIFIVGIGGVLSNGTKHDERSADYDDFSSLPSDVNELNKDDIVTDEIYKTFLGMNGDIIVWNPVLEDAFELSSMGIRVDKTALERQLVLCKTEERKNLAFHRDLLAGRLPECIGGGIGQSRLCMFLLRRRHIGEVQCSIWPLATQKECAAKGINLL